MKQKIGELELEIEEMDSTNSILIGTILGLLSYIQ